LWRRVPEVRRAMSQTREAEKAQETVSMADTSVLTLDRVSPEVAKRDLARKPKCG
jgi:hypothetical protein